MDEVSDYPPVEIEFIICWDDNSWSTDVCSYRKGDLKVDSDGDIDFDSLCRDRLSEEIDRVAHLAGERSPSIVSPVHVGIFRVSW